MKQAEIAFTEARISCAARSFLSLTKNFSVFTFSGELGAGKTTFIAAVCRELGVTEIVSSPTFAIVQQYTTEAGQNIYHMDLYRIRDEEEAIQSGIEDCLLSGDLCFVEWPEHAPEILPRKTVRCTVNITGRDSRKLIVHIPE